MTLDQVKRRIKLYYILFYVNCVLVVLNVAFSQFDTAALQLGVAVLMIAAIYGMESVKEHLEQKQTKVDTQDK